MRFHTTTSGTPRGKFPNGRNETPNDAFPFPNKAPIIATLMLLVAMQSCYVTKMVYTENIFSSWVGQSAQELMIQQGSPTQIISDGKDGQVYIYDNSSTVTASYSSPGQFYARPSGPAVPGYQPSQLNYQPGNTVSNQFVMKKKVEYFVNRDGYIYAWHSTGYPKTYEQRFSKKELQSGSVDMSLFNEPTNKQNHQPLGAPQIDTQLFDSTKYNYTGYKRKKL